MREKDERNEIEKEQNSDEKFSQPVGDWLGLASQPVSYLMNWLRGNGVKNKKLELIYHFAHFTLSDSSSNREETILLLISWHQDGLIGWYVWHSK